MITYFYRKTVEDQLATVPKYQDGCWVHASKPDEAELDRLATDLKLDRDLLTDALDPDEIPRLEREDGNLYMYMRHSSRNGDQVVTSPVLLVVGAKFVATVAPVTVPELEKPALTDELITVNRTQLLLELARILLSTYDRNATFLTRQIRSARTNLNVASVSNRDFIRFVTIEDALNEFLSELVPSHSMLVSLHSGRNGLNFSEDDRDHAEDLAQETSQLIDTSRGALKTIINVREAYSNIMTNNLNRQMKLLTSLTVVLTIPTIIFSLFGMNVPVPGARSGASFSAIILLTLVICSGIFGILYRRRWF